jgi:hypothetical protein
MLSPALLEIHRAWAQQDQAPRRACVLCVHSQDCARLCGHPSAAEHAAALTTEQARARNGICGPNAALMTSDWL